VLTILYAVAGCAPRSAREAVSSPSVEQTAAISATDPFEKLSQYALFTADGSTQEPAEGVIPYDLNTPLFSDYAAKFRFIKLPPGAHATYRSDDVFDLPTGTLIAKTFAYPVDARDPSKGRRLIETRILKHDPDGWVGLPYVWNASQTEASLDVAGSSVDVSWIHSDGRQRQNSYIIPNTNQCKGCHVAGERMSPIGPKARQLNRDYAYRDGTENQLAYWSRHGLLDGAPAPADAPRLPVWDDTKSGPVDARARAWIEINCAHCHQPDGPARNTGLDLRAAQRNPSSFGVFKTPVAAGRGSGGLEFDIVPSQPDKSILAFRIASTHPGIMMPELGKRLVHEEGVALVREWITAMNGK
jgi:uncharacterized repeat protein (TIGR03806 family)